MGYLDFGNQRREQIMNGPGVDRRFQHHPIARTQLLGDPGGQILHLDATRGEHHLELGIQGSD